ncbi:NUDIX hydrolase domain-like protein [Hyaloraphidium curvatum]|nr:NUDIX hydrolase domain-like protein [Hyaloraphidium curvatum]
MAAPSPPHLLPRIVSKEPFRDGEESKWLALRKIRFLDAHGKEGVWEAAERTTRPEGGDCDSVAVFALLRRTGHPPATLLVEQFRPAVGCRTLELPAGLVDPGESPAEAALRELREETGFRADPASVRVSGVLCNAPDLTSDTMRFVECEVDLDDPANADGERGQQLGDDEDIVVHRVELAGLPRFLEVAAARGCVADAFSGPFAAAIELRQLLGLQMGFFWRIAGR